MVSAHDSWCSSGEPLWAQMIELDRGFAFGWCRSDASAGTSSRSHMVLTLSHHPSSRSHLPKRAWIIENRCIYVTDILQVSLSHSPQNHLFRLCLPCSHCVPISTIEFAVSMTISVGFLRFTLLPVRACHGLPPTEIDGVVKGLQLWWEDNER